MKLSEELKVKLISEIEKIWDPKIRKCPICNHQVWSIGETVFEMREFNQGSIVIGANSRIFPVLPLICKHCGYTILFNAINLGLVNISANNEKMRKE